MGGELSFREAEVAADRTGVATVASAARCRAAIGYGGGLVARSPGWLIHFKWGCIHLKWGCIYLKWGCIHLKWGRCICRLPASDWSTVRIYLRFPRLIGPLRRRRWRGGPGRLSARLPLPSRRA
eukprot:9357558-Pyramimonas_sp.AAC.1